MYLLANTIQPYAWGSTDAIPKLLGGEITGKPQAELWLGAHPLAPSQLVSLGIGLDEFEKAHPEAMGPSGKLPFLMKVLAAAEPLSLQVHPNLEQAKAGFAEEDARGVAKDDPARNYKDANHKPEMLVALTDFSALSGLRDPQAAIADIEMLLGAAAGGGEEGRKLLKRLRAGELEDAFLGLLRGGEGVRELVRALIEGAGAKPQTQAAQTVTFISEFHGDDPGVAAALLLNRVDLKPRQAVFLGAGNIHAYLHGLGIELMANSDNVLRAGLTPKHIDIDELAKIASFEPVPPPVLPHDDMDYFTEGLVEYAYRPATVEFQLWDSRLSDSRTRIPPGPAILLVLKGEVRLSTTRARFALPESATELTLTRGQSVFIAAEEYVEAAGADCRIAVSSVDPRPRAFAGRVS
ncbi:MAG: mannose-6-phosphate isomerase, class I [Propionibacteriaceae bacterium]|jgi:mannose-6-phosphate isomerase|nr:mannose-6-phosphate isomerase, class I [Propionibacteriaceae bacterium]